MAKYLCLFSHLVSSWFFLILALSFFLFFLNHALGSMIWISLLSSWPLQNSKPFCSSEISTVIFSDLSLTLMKWWLDFISILSSGTWPSPAFLSIVSTFQYILLLLLYCSSSLSMRSYLWTLSTVTLQGVSSGTFLLRVQNFRSVREKKALLSPGVSVSRDRPVIPS